MVRQKYTYSIVFNWHGLSMTEIKKVIYTCITGAYDDACAHVYVDNTWEYVMFTDNPYLLGMDRYMHWDIRPLQYNKLTNVKNARWHKINAHKLFPEHDISLWIDGNIVIMNSDFFQRINKLIKRGDIICIPPHPERRCIYDEAEKIKELKIDNKNTVNQEMRRLRLTRYPPNNGLNETCIMLRRHNHITIKRMQQKWWRMVQNYSKRDQLSYNWVAWRCKIKTTPLFETPGEHRQCKELLFVHKRSHNQNPTDNFNTWVAPRWIVHGMAVFILHSADKKDFINRHSR